MGHTITAIHPHCSILGEGPVWDARSNKLLWVDIVQSKLFEFNPLSQSLITFETGSMIGSFALCNDGNIIAALKNGFAFINRQTGNIELIKNPEADKPANRFNDGKCDPYGRFWAGTMSLNEKDNSGSLYSIDAEKNIRQNIADVTISNGICWSLDDTRIYYIDTPTMEVVQFDYQKETGLISNKKTIIQITPEDGYPDGMTIDAEGMLWIAHWGGWQITRWNPETGDKICFINLPVSKVTSICFGGKNFSEIFVTSASIGLSESEIKKEPLAGCTFVIKESGFSGLPMFEFKKHQ